MPHCNRDRVVEQGEGKSNCCRGEGKHHHNGECRHGEGRGNGECRHGEGRGQGCHGEGRGNGECRQGEGHRKGNCCNR